MILPDGFIEKHKNEIDGILNCFDRVVLLGTLPNFCHPGAMTGYLFSQNIRVFDYTKFARDIRDQIKANAERLAHQNGFEIEYINKKNFRKEDRIRSILEKRGTHPGLVHIFSGLEVCTTYQPYHDKNTGKNYLRWDNGKCLHYYFYFIDKVLGLCFLRVPTHCPFRLEFYFNGHNRLDYLLEKAGVAYEKQDNAFTKIADFSKANQLASEIDIRKLHAKLDRIAETYCPFLRELLLSYHWSLMQVEYSTDIVFKRVEDLQPFYSELLQTLVHSVKPENIATFLGKKELSPIFKGEAITSLQRRRLGTRIKHEMGPVSIKMYDKFGKVLRIEVTVVDVSFFRVYRTVQTRNGDKQDKWTKMKKSIYSLLSLQNVLSAANHRYLEFLGLIQTHERGVKSLEKITSSKKESQHCYKGFSLFSLEDLQLWKALLRGEFTAFGFRNSALRKYLPLNAGQMTRLLKRLRVHGLIKKVGTRHKYYLTRLGMNIATAVLKIRDLILIPQLSPYQATSNAFAAK